jgi:hypothetical protein
MSSSGARLMSFYGENMLPFFLRYLNIPRCAVPYVVGTTMSEASPILQWISDAIKHVKEIQ